MSEEAIRQFYSRVPPQAGTTPGLGVTWIAATTTAAVYDLQTFPDMFGKMLDLYADGGKIWFFFSSDGVPVISKTTTPGVTIAAGTVATAPVPIQAANTGFRVRLNHLNHRFLHVQADTGTPTLIITPSSQALISQ